MPEGDTVWLAAKHLTPPSPTRCSARPTSGVPPARHHRPGRAARPGGRRPRQAPADPARRRAHPAHALPHGRQLAPLPPGETWRGGPDHEVRVVLEVPDRAAVGYRLPVVELAPDHRGGHASSGTSVPTCSTTPGVRPTWPRPYVACGRGPTARSGSRCSTRPAGRAREPLHERLCFLRGLSPWTPVSAVDTATASRRWSRSAVGCSGPTARPRRRSRPATPAAAGSTGSSSGPGSPAAGAGPRSVRPSRATHLDSG